MPAYKLDFIKRLSLPAVVVTADTPSQAIRFVAQALMSCTTMRGEEVASAVMSGLKIYDARDPQVEMDLEAPDRAPTVVAREMFVHKQDCAADPWTPIMGKGCRCAQLEIPREVTDGDSTSE